MIISLARTLSFLKHHHHHKTFMSHHSTLMFYFSPKKKSKCHHYNHRGRTERKIFYNLVTKNQRQTSYNNIFQRGFMIESDLDFFFFWWRRIWFGCFGRVKQQQQISLKLLIDFGKIFWKERKMLIIDNHWILQNSTAFRCSILLNW